MRFKTQVIVNPESNKGRTRKRWGEIRDGLRSFIREFKFEFTEKPLHATEIARQAIKDGTELVIGVGGDGTMNEIANGFFEDRRIINPETTLGVVPSGSGCDLTKSLRIPAGLKDALKVITEAPSVRMDVGKVRFTSNAGGQEERFFLIPLQEVIETDTVERFLDFCADFCPDHSGHAVVRLIAISRFTRLQTMGQGYRAFQYTHNVADSQFRRLPGE